MSRKYKPNKRIVTYYFFAVVFLIVLFPFAATLLFPGSRHPGLQNHSIEIPETVTIYRTATDTYDTVDFEEYVAGVVAAEMPKTFHEEALKAQAVASRTYALGRILAGRKLCDSVHCQAYRDYNIPRKVRNAVKATCGQILTYDDELAASALYFSSSGGPTENSEDVFQTAYPYLTSVSSDYEPDATHRNEKTTMKISDFSTAVKNAFPELNFGKITKKNIKIRSHTRGGRVAVIKVGGQTLSGTDIRKALSLSSARFTVSFDKGKIIITSNGCGHGVGMSQYGANGLAEKGKSYEKILSHYYRGTKVEG